MLNTHKLVLSRFIAYLATQLGFYIRRVFPKCCFSKNLLKEKVVSRTRNVLFAIGLFLPAIVTAQTLPLFSEKTPIKVVLTAPLTQIYQDKKKPLRPYLDAQLSYSSDNEKTIRIPLRVKTRGNFRRKNCAMPPLRLDFKAKNNDGNVFKQQNKLKLVAPCRRGKNYQQFVALEYLAYQLFEEISDIHFKTRLVDVSYLDTGKKRKPWVSTGFLIEDIKHVGKRHQKQQIKTNKVSRKKMDLAQTALVELFQLFIGNTDYSTIKAPVGNVCCHNNRILGSKDGVGKFIPIPYDFDASGIVDAPYSQPAPGYPIDSVRKRYFTGWCKSPQHFENAIAVFKDKRKTIYDMVEQAPMLNDFYRGRTRKFISRFYQIIDNPERVKREILNRCRGQVVQG